MTTSYTIKFTATDDASQSALNKPTISITDGTTDTTSTDLKLLGKGSSPFGDTIWSNMVHLLENFCSKNEPLHPTIGQLWYDSANNKLKVRNTLAAWVEVGTGSGSSTNYFTTSNNGLVLSGYDVNLSQNLKVGVDAEVLGDTKVVKLTSSGSLISSAETNHEFMNNITSSTDAKFKPYFITKAYADEHYFGGINNNNSNEFDTSSTFDTVILPAKVVHTGYQVSKSVSLPSPASTNIIDITQDVAKEGSIFNVTGFAGSSGANPTIKLPSPVDYNNCTITVTIQYAATATNARNKTLDVTIMGPGTNTTILWEGGTKPTTSTAGIDIFQFICLNEMWFGTVIGKGFA